MLQIRLLGQFDVRLDGKRVIVSSRAGQSLLAYLALTAGVSHRREKLAGVFWPDTTDENARKYLRQELWRIRKVLSAGDPDGKDLLIADEFTLKFNPEAEYWLDVAQIEKPDLDLQSLISNLSLYQGELLPGFYDEWVSLERERVQATFDTRMEQLLEQLVTAERWIAVQEWGERWLTLSGVREPAYRALMLSSGARGDMAKVASLYQRCTDELMEYLGVEPSAETHALYEGLQKGTKKLRGAVQTAGTITFLFTDIEGSTRLLEKMGDQYAVALSDHHEIMRTAVQKWHGREMDTQGDSFFVAFPRAIDAVQCAVEAQRALIANSWPQDEYLRVRMGLHTGEPLIASMGYIGMDVHRAARIGDAGHGGQILLSQTTRELIGQDLPEGMQVQDLGEHRLKDMKFPTSIYQLVAEGLPAEFSPIRTKFTGVEAPTPGEAPFKGLQFFDEDDSDLFFGRETLTAKLVRRLHEANFLSVIIGASGSGKSSVVRAGVVPAIKKGNALINGTKPPEDIASWQVNIFTPTAHPLEALAIALTRDSESVTSAATLVDDLSKDPRSLHFFLARQTQARDSDAPRHILLVIDQFEELFTLCRDNFEREAFIDNLLTALTPTPLPLGEERTGEGHLTLIITLRADFYAHLAHYPELRDAVAQQQEYIGPMTTEELRLAIEEPARHGHWDFEPGLVDLILRDVGDEPGALPLLSHALLETWKRRAGHTLTLKGYADAGGVRGAIAHTAESVYQNLLSEEQVIARNVFVRLTELGEGTEDTRRRVTFDEIMSHTEDTDEVREVLNTLAEARLITLGEETVEVAHEALIREWPQLREWLNQDREGLQLHRRLTEATREWELLEHDDGVLYRGAQLAQAREWAGLHPNALNAGEQAFLDASNTFEQAKIAEREAQQKRELEAAQKLAETERQSVVRLRLRNRVITGVGVVAIVLAGLATLFSRQANNNAQNALNAEATAIANAEIADDAKVNALNAQSIAESERLRAEDERLLATSRELAARSTSNLDVDPERSVLLALQGLSLTHTREAEEALHQSVASLRTLKVMEHPDFIGSVDYSPDGKFLLTANDDGIARVWDVETGQEVFGLPAQPDWVNHAVFSPDGTLIATAINDGTAQLWSVRTKAEIFTLTGHTAFVIRVTFSPDGRFLATGSGDGIVKVWDVLTGQEIQTFSGHTNRLNFLSFSPDGTRLAASSNSMLIIWDVSTGSELLNIKDSFNSAAFSPDGKRLAAGMITGLCKKFDVEDGSQILQLSGHSANVVGIKFSPDGKQIASASLDGTAKIWDAETGQELITLAGHTIDVSSIDFSPDGKSVATGSGDNTARIWDITQSGSKEALTLSGRQFRNVHFSPDDKRVVTAGFTDGVVQVWDAESGQEILHIDAHPGSRVYQAVFSPAGDRIATSSADNTVKTWDANTGQELFTISGFGEGSIADGLFPGVLDVAFSPDGNKLATASGDGVAKVWDSRTGIELFSLDGDTSALS
ncbi:MAG: adenylate/guanylate cyclase domain-containing protein, partial [Anaerolineales bacterium]